ncbi:F0F1 ATP synthase subunit A [Clostridium hydrogenum]|uniref:F0F1 ATP synthase subunit A n=1 Tax=Clostridium hydrogenum TaxID=2855764 RepID=UPI001F1F86B9|nr:F0F1 ATP synthase subunit A [Clostridium hydrogenum]
MDISIKAKPIFNAFGIQVTDSMIIQLVVLIVVAILCYALTRNLKKIPDKKQNVLEAFVQTVNNAVGENMGKEYKWFAPYVAALALYLLIMNLMGLIGFEPPTKDINVPLTLAALTFFIVQGNAIKRNGLKEYFLGYTKPFIPLLPINIIERLTLPLSLTLRLFGNMVAGSVIMALIYGSLGHAALVIPIIGHAYFDLFDGAVQMIVFVMLTMVQIKLVAEE